MSGDELLCWRRCKDAGTSEKERESVRQRMLESYLPLVQVVVRRMALAFPSAIAEPDDFFQAGVIGLMSAFERFDPDYGVEFRSFASHRIRGQVLDELRKMDWIPRSIRQKKEFVAPLHSLEELQERQDRGEGRRLLDSAPRQEAVQENELENTESRVQLAKGMAQLPEREAEVLWLCFYEEKSLREVGDMFSLSEARICQIRSQALERLRGKTSLVAA